MFGFEFTLLEREVKVIVDILRTNILETQKLLLFFLNSIVKRK